jgi:hypothetical protein
MRRTSIARAGLAAAGALAIAAGTALRIFQFNP